MITSVLVPLDLTPTSDRVVGRVRRLPLADNAQVTLMHVVPDVLATIDRKRVETSALGTLQEEADALARLLPRSMTVRSVVTRGVAATEIAQQAQDSKAEIIVMGRCGSRPLRDVILGATAERVVRRSQLPVLVVRKPPRAVYRRAALAMELDEAVEETLAWLLRLTRHRSSVSVIHAFEVPYRGNIYSDLPLDAEDRLREEYRVTAKADVQQRLTDAMNALKLEASASPRFRLKVRYGSARDVIAESVERAENDLLVMGTRGHSGIAHAFLGSVAGDVLRRVPCDVLVVPPLKTTH